MICCFAWRSGFKKKPLSEPLVVLKKNFPKKNSPMLSLIFFSVVPGKCFLFILLIYEAHSYMACKVEFAVRSKCALKLRAQTSPMEFRMGRIHSQCILLRIRACGDVHCDVQRGSTHDRSDAGSKGLRPANFCTSVRLASVAGDAEAVAQLRCRSDLPMRASRGRAKWLTS